MKFGNFPEIVLVHACVVKIFDLYLNLPTKVVPPVDLLQRHHNVSHELNLGKLLIDTASTSKKFENNLEIIFLFGICEVRNLSFDQF